MTSTNISFRQTNLFPDLILDYLDQDDKVKEFYKYAPSIEEMDKVIHDKMQLFPLDAENNVDRKLLVNTILAQYSGIENIQEKTEQNIHAFESSLTYCIVTAHQLNIFTGPLYYIYKIAQTISTCRQLTQKYPNNNFVPVYWMGSEDHDFEEINHIHLYNKKIEWTDKKGGATGEYHPGSLLPLVDELSAILGEEKYSSDLTKLFKTAYSLPTLTMSVRYIVNALFGEFGLVVVDGNDRVFKQQFSDIMKDELQNRNSVKLVMSQLQKLTEKGYKEQAFPREINLFYLMQNSRERIELDQVTGNYKVLNTGIEFTTAEILVELDEYPERFSPNVILRPLFQQKTLPSLAYIGGAGELCYWLQLKSLFEFYEINFPQLLLRNSALIINENISGKISKMGFTALDFLKETDQLIKEFISKNTDEDFDLSSHQQNIEAEFVRLQELTKNIDPTLVSFIGAEMQKSIQSIDVIRKKINKSLKQKNETELNQVTKIKNQLFPENSLQERTENFATYYVKYGPDFIRQLVDAFDVYQKQFLLIHL